MDRPECAILEGSNIERHFLHNDSLGDQATGYSANTRDIEQLVNLELGQFLIKSAGLGLAHARGKQVKILLDVPQSVPGH